MPRSLPQARRVLPRQRVFCELFGGCNFASAEHAKELPASSPCAAEADAREIVMSHNNSRGCAHGRAVQVEAWSKASHPPPNPADADDARPLGASATHSKKWQNIASRRRAGARVLMMLAGWPPGVVHGGPETRHSLGGCETRRFERPPGEANGETRVR